MNLVDVVAGTYEEFVLSSELPHNQSQQVIANVCVCVGGYMQPLNVTAVYVCILLAANIPTRAHKNRRLG